MKGRPAQRKAVRPKQSPVVRQQRPSGLGASGEPLAMELQRTIGNRGVGQFLASQATAKMPSARVSPPRPDAPSSASRAVTRVVQRNEIAYDDPGETIYNQTSTQDSKDGNNASVARGTAGAKAYGGGTVASGQGIRYEMKRSDTQVDVTVRIRFVDQTRVTPANLPDGTPNPAFNPTATTKAVIPETDNRRTFATDMCRSVEGKWNGKTAFVSHKKKSFLPTWLGGNDPTKDVRLNVVFHATPVFGLTETAHSEVKLYGDSTPANALQGHPIDAGNYYKNTGGYGASAEMIYAHEYGHLIGLADEYSNNSMQTHMRLHRMSPNQSAMGQALNKAAVRRMVMAALARPLFFRLSSAMGEVSKTFMAGKKPLQQALQSSLKSSMSDPSVQGLLTAWATGKTSAKAQKSIPGAVGFETGSNLSERSLAGRAVAAGLQPSSLSGLIASAHFKSMRGVHDTPVKLSDSTGASASVSIDIAGTPVSSAPGAAQGTGSGVWDAAASGPAAANAAGVADSVLGASPVPGARIPPVRPSSTLLGQISALPGTWSAASGGVAPMLSSAIVMPQVIAALASALAAAGAPGAPTMTTPQQVYRGILAMVQNIGTAVGTNVVRSAVAAQVDPLIAASVKALETAVEADVEATMGTPAGALAAKAPKDPKLAALAAQMQGQLVTDMAGTIAAKPGNLDNPGGAAPAQSVTFTTVGMMGDNTADVRPDQFADLVSRFNTADPKLVREDEEPFKATKP